LCSFRLDDHGTRYAHSVRRGSLILIVAAQVVIHRRTRCRATAEKIAERELTITSSEPDERVLYAVWA